MRCLTVLWFGFVGACGKDGDAPAGQNAVSGETTRRPNVIVYLVDTLRQDHLGCYGYARDTSPRLDALAAEAVLFENALAPCSWTRPSTASLLSGLHPLRHGAVAGRNPVGEHVVLLSSYLQQAGYHTAAFVTNPHILPVWGFGRGFDSFYDIESSRRTTRADVVNEKIFEHLATRRDEPFFFYVHTLDPHAPYDPPPAFRTKFSQGRTLPAHVPRPPRVRADTPRETVEAMRSLYDGEIAFNDACFGALLDRLKADGSNHNTLVVFVSDHGEEFQDHGRGGHGHTLYEEQLRIPLVIRFPNGAYAGRRISSRASLMDVMPTILAAVGQSVPAGLDGRDLTPYLAGEADALPDRPMFADLNRQDVASSVQNVMQAVTWRSYKWIHVSAPEPQEMLFDLSSDSAEQANRIDAEPDKAVLLAGLLARFTAGAMGGIHLRFVNAPGEREAGFTARLQTAGRFVNLQQWELDPGDTANVSEDGTTLDVRVRVVNRPNPLGRMPKQIVDEDGVSFQIDPPDAAITVGSITCDGVSGGPLYLGGAKHRCETLPFAFRRGAEALRAHDPAALAMRGEGAGDVRAFGGYLFVVPAAARIAVQADDETVARLRALGYMDVTGSGTDAD